MCWKQHKYAAVPSLVSHRAEVCSCPFQRSFVLRHVSFCLRLDVKSRATRWRSHRNGRVCTASWTMFTQVVLLGNYEGLWRDHQISQSITVTTTKYIDLYFTPSEEKFMMYTRVSDTGSYCIWHDATFFILWANKVSGKWKWTILWCFALQCKLHTPITKMWILKFDIKNVCL